MLFNWFCHKYVAVLYDRIDGKLESKFVLEGHQLGVISVDVNTGATSEPSCKLFVTMSTSKPSLDLIGLIIVQPTCYEQLKYLPITISDCVQL